MAPEPKPPSKQHIQDEGRPMTNHDMNQDQMIKFYRAMSLIRRFEERAVHLRQQGFIPGF